MEVVEFCILLVQMEAVILPELVFELTLHETDASRQPPCGQQPSEAVHLRCYNNLLIFMSSHLFAATSNPSPAQTALFNMSTSFAPSQALEGSPDPSCWLFAQIKGFIRVSYMYMYSIGLVVTS